MNDMKWKGMGCHGMHGMHPGMHGHMHPGMIMFPIMVMFTVGMSVWYTVRLTRALEIMAMLKTLDAMKDKLNDEERAALEASIRAKLYKPGMMGKSCCEM